MSPVVILMAGRPAGRAGQRPAGPLAEAGRATPAASHVTALLLVRWAGQIIL